MSHYYIATNGSKFNAKSLDAVCNLHMLCHDNSMSNLEVSNSIWHREDKNYIEYAGGINEVMDRIGYSEIERMRFGSTLQDLYIPERRKLGYGGSIVAEGRAKDFGSIEVQEVTMDNMVYINVNGDILLDNCNISFESQEKLKLT